MAPEHHSDIVPTPPIEEAIDVPGSLQDKDGSRAEQHDPSQAPEGWQHNFDIANETGRTPRTVAKKFDELEQTHPEQFGTFRGVAGDYRYASAEAAFIIKQALTNDWELAPEGWVSITDLSEELSVSGTALRKQIKKYKKEDPESVKDYCFESKKGKKKAAHVSPQLAETFRQKYSAPMPPEGWVAIPSLTEELGIGDSTVLKHLAELNNPEMFGEFRAVGRGSYSTKYCHPEAATYIRQKVSEYKPVPEGWVAATTKAKELDVSLPALLREISKHIDENPGWIVMYKGRVPGSKGRVHDYLHPDLLQILDETNFPKRARKKDLLEEKMLQESFEDFLESIATRETLEAKDFQDLLDVYGPELVIDILFLHHPEYQKLALPYAKRVIGDYLGEFLLIRGDLQLDKLEKGIQFLSDAKFKEGLTEAIKNDCLKYYNQQRREGLVENDRLTLDGYFENLRSKTESFGTPDWLEVLNGVEEYYKALFEVIQLPNNGVDELEPGRLFPDINQRINILELMGKQKMLIADKMGVGKSASAILAKESLGAKQALVVVPSNVIDVWQKYLSDYKNGDGSSKGYFKEGQAPRVLTINNGLDSLGDLNLSEFDYVLISQERLDKEGYMAFFDQLDYDMLIVDEVHKLKNIKTGKRADSLVKLAEKIEGEEKYLALLSGTPVHNKVGDIAMILKLLYPEKFKDIANKDLTSQILEGDTLDLRSLLVPRMQMKSLAESVEMPSLHEELHVIQMTEQERRVYEVILERDDLTASQKLQILRQLVLNPEMFEVTPTIESSKHDVVSQELHSTFTTKDKVVMFVNGYMDGVIRGDTTIFEGLRLPEGVEVHVIDGKVSKKRRLEIQYMLQEESGKKILLAVSGQTADVGVDYSGAEEVYFYNEPWSEYDRQQQLGRVFRPGLKDDLVSHSFYVEGTIEEGIHRYIDYKYRAVEKLLRGIPISELEQEMLKQAERQKTPNLEVNSGLAESYLSTSAKMLKIFNYVNEIGQEGFVKFGERYWTEYAEYYSEIGSRSYQANTARLSGTVIDGLAREKGQSAEHVRILDVASGPEMLKRHMPEEYQEQVVSVDINPHHFDKVDEKRRVGSFLNLPVADSTMDYVNLSLALHYTERPRKGQYERIRVFQEINRVLVNGGTAVINLAHNHGFKNTELFAEAAKHLGFEIVEDLSGEVGSGNNFKSQMLVLQKVSSCTQDTSDLVQAMGPTLLQGFKFAKTGIQLRDSRKITTRFSLSNGKDLDARLNEADQAVFDEEQAVLSLMAQLRKTYRSIKDIPSEVVYQSGLSRAKTDKKRDSYVLFKSLETGNGAVITR